MRAALDLTLEERQVFDAAFGSGESAVAAWEAFTAAHDLDRIYFGHPGLMPLLYLNLEREGVKHPWLEKLKGYYRYTWCRNQLALKKLSLLAESLAAAGIRSLALGGAATLLAAGQTRAERSLYRLELYVDPLRYYRAREICALEASLFESGDKDKALLPVVTSELAGGAAREWLARAEKIPAGGSAIEIPAATDRLIDSMVRGVRGSYDPRPLWMVDAIVTARAMNASQWGELVGRLHALRCLAAGAAGLASMNATLPGIVPDTVAREAAASRPRLAERVEPALSLTSRAVRPIRAICAKMSSR